MRAVTESETASGRPRFARGGGRRLAEFSRQLAVLLEAGIPLDHALGIAGEVADDPGFRDVIARVRRSVEEGTSLADALARHPRVFDELYVSMVRAGEAGGALDQILKRLAEFLEEWQRIRDVVVSALLYPLFLSVFAAGAVTVLMVFVVPRFAEVFGDMGARLPAPTRVADGRERVSAAFLVAARGRGRRCRRRSWRWGPAPRAGASGGTATCSGSRSPATWP